MVLGCIFASQANDMTENSRKHLLDALVYMCEAEKTMRDIIRDHQNNVKELLQLDEDGSSTKSVTTAEQLFEDQVILAFRFYSHGIATSNYFLQVEEHDDKSLDFDKNRLHELDKKGKDNSSWWKKQGDLIEIKNPKFRQKVFMLVDALDNLTKCLSALPTTSPQAEEFEDDEPALKSDSSIDDFASQHEESKK